MVVLGLGLPLWAPAVCQAALGLGRDAGRCWGEQHGSRRVFVPPMINNWALLTVRGWEQARRALWGVCTWGWFVLPSRLLPKARLLVPCRNSDLSAAVWCNLHLIVTCAGSLLYLLSGKPVLSCLVSQTRSYFCIAFMVQLS